MAITGFTLNGLDLRTLATDIGSINGWDSFPGLKASGVQYAFTHGEYIGGRRFYSARDIDITMIIMATDEDGLVTTTPEEHVQDNIDALMAALHSTSGELALVRTMPDGSTRTAYVRPLDVIRFQESIGPIFRGVNLSLRMGYPFWNGAALAQTISGSASVTNLGTAPINNMIVTFTTAGRITVNATGEWIESADAGLVLDVKTGIVTSGNSGALEASSPWLLQLEPGANALTVTGGNKSISGFHGYF